MKYSGTMLTIILAFEAAVMKAPGPPKDVAGTVADSNDGGGVGVGEGATPRLDVTNCFAGGGAASAAGWGDAGDSSKPTFAGANVFRCE